MLVYSSVFVGPKTCFIRKICYFYHRYVRLFLEICIEDHVYKISFNFTIYTISFKDCMYMMYYSNGYYEKNFENRICLNNFILV